MSQQKLKRYAEMVEEGAITGVMWDEVENWAAANCGGPGLGLERSRETKTPDTARAAVVERAMCQLKRTRPRYFEYLKARHEYHRGATTDEATARQFEIATVTFRLHCATGYEALYQIIAMLKPDFFGNT
jgi:hypothetical protein